MGSLSIKNKKASATFQNRKGSWLLTVHFLPPLASHKTRSLINDGGGNYENTNITGEKVVNHSETQLNDALIESCALPNKETAARCGPPLVYQFAVQPISLASRERYQHPKELGLAGPGHHRLDLFTVGLELGVSLVVASP